MLLLLCLLCLAVAATPKPFLRFKADGRFKIAMFSDAQDGPDLDPRTSAAISGILDAEQPDLVVLAGDSVDTGACRTKADLEQAIAQVVQPMEERAIPWAHVMGNHDVDGLGAIGVDKKRMMPMYRRYPHNVTPLDPREVYGVGNGLLQVLASGSEEPKFGVWLLDSNAYAPESVGGQCLGGYDWIHTSQVAWYYAKSKRIERELRRKLPALMFFHICLPEFVRMAAAGEITGERNEPECPALVNGGMFAAVLDRGDVLGIYAGHDHTNTYEGTWLGVRLGFSGSVGYASYGLDSKDEAVRNRIRGARVFVIDEAAPTRFETAYVYVAALRACRA